MRGPTLRKLKYPRWFTILFYLLTIVIPVGLIASEGMKVPDQLFRVGFMTIALLAIVWFIIKKQLVSKIETKLLSTQATLELNYSTDIGDSIKTKQLWFENEQKLLWFSMTSVLLNGGLLVLMLMGVASSFMKIRLSLIIIIVLYLIAYTLKTLIVLAMKGEGHA
jgi:hypothetical protein